MVRLRRAEAKAKAKAKAVLGCCGFGGTGTDGGTRRKPIPGARPRHPCRGRSRHLHPSRLRQFPGDGGQQHGVTDDLKENKKDAAFAASFLFVSTRSAGVSAAWMRRPSLQGWIHGVSREPNPPDPARLLLQQSVEQARLYKAPRHEGLSRWLESQFRADPLAQRFQILGERIDAGRQLLGRHRIGGQVGGELRCVDRGHRCAVGGTGRQLAR